MADPQDTLSHSHDPCDPCNHGEEEPLPCDQCLDDYVHYKEDGGHTSKKINPLIIIGVFMIVMWLIVFFTVKAISDQGSTPARATVGGLDGVATIFACVT